MQLPSHPPDHGPQPSRDPDTAHLASATAPTPTTRPPLGTSSGTRSGHRLPIAISLTVALTGVVMIAALPSRALAPHHGRLNAPQVTAAHHVVGQYQSAYSARNEALWVTGSVGNPATSSTLSRIDPQTLQVEQVVQPPRAAYGVAVDDEHNTVWTTNTRDNSVSVLDQATGTALVTVPGVEHAREVAIDERHDTAWVSAHGSGELVAFDTSTWHETRRVRVPDSAPTGIAVDRRGTVHAADHRNDRVISVRRGSDTPAFTPTGDAPLGIAVSRDGHTAWTADQASGTLSVLDLRRQVRTRAVRLGAGEPNAVGSKSVQRDPRSGRVLVANRETATVSVVDPRRGRVTATIHTGPHTNHVSVGGGSAWVLDKSGGDTSADGLYRVRLRR